MLRNLNLCRAKGRGYRALMGRMPAAVMGLLLVCVAALVAPSAASAEVNGSAAGWRDPASGTLDLIVQATPDEVPLQNASASLGGVLLDVEGFGDGTCETTCPARVELSVDTTRVSDGQRELVVWVTDADGVPTELERRTITIENTPRVFTPTVTVQIGSGTINPPSSPPGGGDTPGAGPSCRSPRLSMRLTDKPLRYRRGVPVLKRGKTYRYAGTLTCRIDGRRRPALRGTKVQVRNRLRGWTITKPSIELRKAGDVVARLAYRSSRVVIFRVVGAGGEVVRVRIPIRVVRR
jgi:hypothetical protein